MKQKVEIIQKVEEKSKKEADSNTANTMRKEADETFKKLFVGHVPEALSVQVADMRKKGEEVNTDDEIEKAGFTVDTN